MSGHSKWHSIKHKKGAADAARGKLFARLCREIEVAARTGGGDPDTNAGLRTKVQKAKEASVPKDNIENAIKRGTGELEGVVYEAMNYEGYAPNGIAIYVECLSDNRNRTGSEIKNIFSRNGGAMAEPGAVAWQFERKGLIHIGPGSTEDDVLLAALDAGAEDVTEAGDGFQVITPPTELHVVRSALEEVGIKVESSDLTMIASTSIELEDEASARQVLRVVDALEDHDDVQGVYANFDIPENILDMVMG
ncbi:MAG: YebC/PmpR family DNA-binding transcriptional regulator [Acidimicrobiia bacterium]|nr:YebC/PmpR family DNA-binding transcriptional regulator [Acidimicrobiia bacterium]MBJ7513536.1 YebC/PmpR family DNA-binding transcriptional regulator [Acidimicrobiia bacterium]